MVDFKLVILISLLLNAEGTPCKFDFKYMQFSEAASLFTGFHLWRNCLLPISIFSLFSKILNSV